MATKDSFETIDIPEIKTADISYGYNSEVLNGSQIDPSGNRDISGEQYFAMDIWASSGSTGDASFRNINLIGLNGDKEKTYTQEIISTLGNTTAKITKSYTIDTPVNNIIKVPSGKVFKISTYFNSSTQSLRVSITGSKRYLKGGNTDLSSTVPELVFINSGTTTSNVTLMFQTSASERPIFGFLIEIK